MSGPAPAIGHSTRRLEDPRRVRGRGQYVDDLALANTAHAVVLRSPHAHARIRSVEPASARSRPGVCAVLTHGDLPPGLLPIPIRLTPDDSLRAFFQYPLAADRVRYVGEPVALVVAESRAAAEDAAAELAVDYEPLPAYTDAGTDAGADVRTGSPAALFAHQDHNLAQVMVESFGDVDRALDAADTVVHLAFLSGRHSAVPLETRGLLANYDAGSERLTVSGATKVTHFNRTVLASLLGWPEHRIRLVEPDVGGGFGARGEFYPEDFLIPFAAYRLGRPVKWIEDRMEHLLAINHSRQQVYDLELGLSRAGEFLALKASIVSDMGAYLRTHGTAVQGLTVGMLPGPYHFAAYRGEIRCVLTNKTPTGTYRAPGRFESNAARERLIDQGAAELGMDPVELRLKNLVRRDEMPFDRRTSILREAVVFDSGDYAGALTKAVELAGYAHRPRPRGSQRLRRGVGVACFVEKSGTGPFEGACIRVDPSGELVVATGAAELGQGLTTCLAQIAAEVIPVPPGSITVRHGDTDLLPYGIGSFASRGTVMAGNAVHAAALELRDLILARAAEALGAPVEALRLADGRVSAPGGRGCPLGDLARLPGLEVTRYFHAERMAYPHGVAVAAVRVDTRTGRVVPERIWVVYDVGRVINPQIVAGQIEGGVAQGIGGALLEELCFDEAGQPLSATFADYLLPGTTDVPRITHLNLDRSPSPLNPLGVKGAGEVGIAGLGGALANAVFDALGRPAGARHGGQPVANQLPLTPERVWQWASALDPIGDPAP